MLFGLSCAQAPQQQVPQTRQTQNLKVDKKKKADDCDPDFDDCDEDGWESDDWGSDETQSDDGWGNTTTDEWGSEQTGGVGAQVGYTDPAQQQYYGQAQTGYPPPGYTQQPNGVAPPANPGVEVVDPNALKTPVPAAGGSDSFDWADVAEDSGMNEAIYMSETDSIGYDYIENGSSAYEKIVLKKEHGLDLAGKTLTLPITPAHTGWELLPSGIASQVQVIRTDAGQLVLFYIDKEDKHLKALVQDLNVKHKWTHYKDAKKIAKSEFFFVYLNMEEEIQVEFTHEKAFWEMTLEDQEAFKFSEKKKLEIKDPNTIVNRVNLMKDTMEVDGVMIINYRIKPIDQNEEDSLNLLSNKDLYNSNGNNKLANAADSKSKGAKACGKALTVVALIVAFKYKAPYILGGLVVGAGISAVIGSVGDVDNLDAGGFTYATFEFLEDSLTMICHVLELALPYILKVFKFFVEIGGAIGASILD